MPLTVAQILQLYAEQGKIPYGDEPVSQLEHALQCATLAETAAESPEMILACLLHDLGHLLHHLGRDVGEQGIDDRHEYRVIPYLKPLFEPAVLEKYGPGPGNSSNISRKIESQENFGEQDPDEQFSKSFTVCRDW